MRKSSILDELSELEDKRLKLYKKMLEISHRQLEYVDSGQFKHFYQSIEQKGEIIGEIEKNNKQWKKVCAAGKVNSFADISQVLNKEENNSWLERAQEIVMAIKEIEHLQVNIEELFVKEHKQYLDGVGKAYFGREVLKGYKRGMAVPVKPSPRFVDEDS
ncbi:hypothetical protein PRVXH_000519 [Proteinivorax hydrogeniformans]|uniref:FlgN protein n=1 Tax=Proteinivorax hydrogeniformans TaxID=1826727 RepID=A0AAU8HUY5_9FIRM